MIETETRRISLWQLFATCLRIGATGFGGVMALIALLQEHLVVRLKAVTPEQFDEGVAVGQLLPGPVAIDAAIYCGYRLHGWLGGLAASVGLVLPPFLLMLAIAPLYLHFGSVPFLEAMFRGVRPAVVAVILAAGWRLGSRSLKSVGPVVIALVAFVGTMLNAHPVLLILLAGALGILLCPAPAGGKA